MQQSRAGAGPGIEVRPQPGGSQFLVAVRWLRQLPASPTMVLPLAWLSRCCHHLLLPSWAPTLQGSWRCCSQSPRRSREKMSSTRSGKMSPSRVSGTKEGGGHEGKFVPGGRGVGGQRIPSVTTGQQKADLVAQMIKNPPAVQETWVQWLGWEEGMATHSSILAWIIPMDYPEGLEGYSSWGRSPR